MLPTISSKAEINGQTSHARRAYRPMSDAVKTKTSPLNQTANIMKKRTFFKIKFAHSKNRRIFAFPFREHSSVGLEHLPYKQRVGGSTPSAPTKKETVFAVYFSFMSISLTGPQLWHLISFPEDSRYVSNRLDAC